MTEPLQVGQFAIVDHEPVDRGPNAGIFHGRGPADDRAELYVLAEGTTPAGEAFAGHVVSAIGNLWHTLDLSLTGALRRVFDEAQRNLRDWNQKSIAQHRVSIGLTCFGRRGDSAVIAQAGPSVAFHFHRGQVRAYYSDEEHGRPVGMGPGAEPQLTRIPFDPGDHLLLVSTAALRELDDELIAGIVALPTDRVLPDLYRRLQGLRNLTAVLVAAPDEAIKTGAGAADAADELSAAVIDATAGGVPALPAPQADDPNAEDGYQPSLFIEEPGEPARVVLREVVPRAITTAARANEEPVEIPAPLRRAAGDGLLAALAAERQLRVAMASSAPRASTVAAAGSYSSGPTWRSNPATTGANPASVERRRQRHGSFSRGLVREEAPPAPATVIDPEGALPVEQLAAGVRASTALTSPALAGPMAETIASENAATVAHGGSLVRVRDNMGGRWKGGGGSLSKRRNTTSGQLPPTWLVVIVGLGILLALVGYLVIPGMLEEDRSARYADLVDGAQRMLATSRVQEDPGEKRKALTEAQALLLEAQEADPARSEAGDLINEVAGAISSLDAIHTPAAIDTLADLSQFGDKPVSPLRLTVGEDAAYILDSASSQVIAVALATGEKGAVFAEDKEAKRGRPVATALANNAEIGHNTLLVADSEGGLWAYTAETGLRRVAFAAPAGLTITDIAAWGRDLYVLDAGQSTVYRFSPADGGYGAAPRKHLNTPDIAAARRLMVDDEVITVDANGTLRRFAGQVSLVLSAAGIDKKLAAAEVPQSIGTNGDIAVLDAAADRIVVFRRDGTFDRQYRHKEFQGLTAFAVRDGVGYVFTSSGHLRRVTW